MYQRHHLILSLSSLDFQDNRVFWFPFYFTGISLWIPKSSGPGLLFLSPFTPLVSWLDFMALNATHTFMTPRFYIWCKSVPWIPNLYVTSYSTSPLECLMGISNLAYSKLTSCFPSKFTSPSLPHPGLMATPSFQVFRSKLGSHHIQSVRKFAHFLSPWSTQSFPWLPQTE